MRYPVKQLFIIIVAFQSTFSLNFSLSDDDRHKALYSCDETSEGENLHFDISDTNTTPLTIKPVKGKVSRENYHFKLVFQGNSLDQSSLKKIDIKEKDDWYFRKEFSCDTCDVSLFFLWKYPRASIAQGSIIIPSQPESKPQTGKLLRITLMHVKANDEYVGEGTQVVFNYKNFFKKNNPVNADSGSRSEWMWIRSHLGQRNIPLHIGFSGSNTVVNDYGVTNELILSITNISGVKDIVLTPFSKLKVSFVTGPIPNALGFPDKVAAINFKAVTRDSLWQDSPYWKIYIDKQGPTPVWTLLPNRQLTLEPDSVIYFKLSPIITGHPSGTTNVSILYENIPGYWDGEFTPPIEKGPMAFRENRVGIGTATPTEVLEVKGRIKDTSGYIMPKGGIIMWSGDSASIPQGWRLCNGLNGTPDLKNRFAVRQNSQPVFYEVCYIVKL